MRMVWGGLAAGTVVARAVYNRITTLRTCNPHDVEVKVEALRAFLRRYIMYCVCSRGFDDDMYCLAFSFTPGEC